MGFLDHKTGSSAIGYTRSILQNANNEVFVGFGTAIAINTFVIGYKSTSSSTVDGYGVISMQKIYGMGGDLNAFAFQLELKKYGKYYF